MTISDQGILFTARFEGLVLKPYLCPAGVPTIGYGSTFYENGVKVTLKDAPITKERALALLKFHMAHFAQTVDSYTTDAVNQAQFDSLVDFAYNAGLTALKNSTLLKKVNLDPKDPSIAGEFAKWVYATVGGKKTTLKGLVNRRTAEAKLYSTGQYT